MDTPRELPATLDEVVRVFWSFWSPRLLAVWVVIAAGVRVGMGAPTFADAAVGLAVLLAWPVNEWLIHVFILHYRPRTVLGRTIDFRVPWLHRAHHRDPWRLDLVLIPLRVYLLTPLIVGLGALLVGVASAPLWTGLSVYFALSLHYEWVHFLVHTRYKPRTAPYRRLWRNHRLHHFKNEHYWFGVTMLSGDRVLGTAPDWRSAPTSPTARTLASQPGAEF